MQCLGSYVHLLLLLGVFSAGTVDGDCDPKAAEIVGGNYNLLKDGTTLVYDCPQGQYPYPTQFRFCKDGNRWSPLTGRDGKTVEQAVCRDIRCVRPLEFENGELETIQKFYNISQELRFSCYAGYKLRGSQIRTCLPNGKWSGETAICDDGTAYCHNPGTPIGARKFGTGYQINSVVRYQCSRGLSLIGSRERVCQNSGIWSGSEPECRSSFTFDSKEEIVSKFLPSFLEAASSASQGASANNKSDSLNIYFLIDASKSFGQTRITKAKKALEKLIQKISSYDLLPNYGIVTFATESRMVLSTTSPHSSDVGSVSELLDSVNIDAHELKSGTNIANGFRFVYEMMIMQDLEEKRRGLNPTPVSTTVHHIIILLTDGNYNLGGLPFVAIQQIKEFLNTGGSSQNSRDDHLDNGEISSSTGLQTDIGRSSPNLRDDRLDVYVFGNGHDLNIEAINDLVSHKPDERHGFILKDLSELQEVFEKSLDDRESLPMCGFSPGEAAVDDYEKYPWFARIIINIAVFLQSSLSLKKQKTNKTPGPDGLPVELYQTMQEILGEELLELFNEILEGNKIPKTWTEATITIIPKEDTDPQLIQNYRPISLLNSDYKLFAAILAERTKIVLNSHIHQDQNGFLPGRQIKNNIRTILNTLEYYEVHSDKQASLAFLDAQKAFDNLNWRFLITQLQKMQFGEKYEKVIEGIYTTQTATIIINDDITDKFEITKGVRQGCPLSPLLYILTLEILLRKIREDREIKGLKINKEEYKVQAFADDLAFIIENPLESMPKLFDKIERFGEVAGLKINKNKSKLITKNLTKTQTEELEDRIQIQTAKKIKYLGIWLSTRTSSIKENNYDKLIAQTKKDLDNWTNLHISLLGRIATIKMSILPKFIYLFQVIPIKLPKTFFQTLNKMTSKFIWQGKRPRIKFKLLQDTKERGGMALPDWEVYYDAAKLSWIKDWMELKNPRILEIEGHDIQTGWHSFLWDDKHRVHSYFQRHTIRSSLLQTWLKIKKHHYTKIPNWLSPLEAITRPNLIDNTKIIRYQDMLDLQGKMKTKQQLEIDLNRNVDWWNYIQITSKYKEHIKTDEISKEKQDLDKIILDSDQKLISKIYKYLLRYKMEDETVKETMIKWAQNIKHTIHLDKWEKFWQDNIRLTRAVAYRENQLKMFYRWYMTPTRLAKINPKNSSICWKCQKKQGTFYHLWWTCPIARKFWSNIQNWIEQIINTSIDKEPETFLLGIFTKTYPRDTKYLIIHILTAARMTYAKFWKQEKVPNKTDIIQKVLECAELDKLSKEIQDREDSDYYKIWEKWYEWLNNTNEENRK